MDRVLWATDIHLECADQKHRKEFFDKACQADVLFVTGDIGNGNKQWLEMLSDNLPSTQIYFILGNHDYYRKSFKEMDAIVRNVCKKKANLHWLSDTYYSVVNNVPIVGHEGWYDCQYGKTGRVIMNDFTAIKDVRIGYMSGVEQLMIDVFHKKAKQSADHFERSLNMAFNKFDRAILLTHVPPFDKAAWHLGSPSDENWLPFMASKTSGDSLMKVMKNNLDKKLLVLCGHTHSSGVAQILPNLEVWTGEAEYMFPEIYKDLGNLDV